MQLLPDSHEGFVLVVGLATIACFGVGLGIIAYATPTELGRRELLGFGIGFSLFVGVYFLAMHSDRLLTRDRYEE